MRGIIFGIIFALLCSCEEKDGIWISESCSEYEKDIQWAIDRLNALEDDKIIWIEGTKKSDPYQSRQKALNDDIDFFYCFTSEESRITGYTNNGAGDIYLYLGNLFNLELLPCLTLHELGHRYLLLGHSGNMDSIMYPEMYYGCKDKSIWE